MALFLQKALLRNTSRRSVLMLKDWNSSRDRNKGRQLSTEAGSKLAGKVAVITGAASGIGRATAAEFIRSGAHVVIADVQRQLGEETAKELGPNAAFIPCDVTQESDISAAIDFAISEHGRLDIMYNNAGIGGSIVFSITDLDLSEFDKIMNINVRGAVAGIKHAARVMIPRRTGCILCTASITGIMGGLSPHAYSISKFATTGVVKSAASELCKYGIRVNCISPFAIPTPFSTDAMSALYPGLDESGVVEIIQGAGELKGANCEPVDIAKAAVYLASDDAKYVSGHNLVVDGGFTAFKSLQFPPPAQMK
ncbi:hypothetical protein AAC387_Pa09g0423 [Persea americana]